MARYRARHCPQCNYFVGFAVAAHLGRAAQAAITNFCLNCSYKFPVHGIIRGPRRIARPLRRAALRLIRGAASKPIGALGLRSQNSQTEANIAPPDYARHLRTIGQDLETLRVSAFNLEYTGDAYLVWLRAEEQREAKSPLLRVGKHRLQKLWRHRPPLRPLGHEEPYAAGGSQMRKRLRYSVQELDRIESEQRALRRKQSRMADGHSLSQLLRTIGDLVGRRGERLLAVAWQEFSVGVVVETAQGRKEIDVYRPDNLYDLWVSMYLKRQNRALSDIPR